MCACERERERGSYTSEHYDKWGMINKSVAKELFSILIGMPHHHQVTKIPKIRYIYISCARLHMYEENIGTKM